MLTLILNKKSDSHQYERDILFLIKTEYTDRNNVG